MGYVCACYGDGNGGGGVCVCDMCVCVVYGYVCEVYMWGVCAYMCACVWHSISHVCMWHVM